MNKEKIKTREQQIKKALESVAGILVYSDAENDSFYMNFSKDDVFNSIIIMNSVINNYAIKHGKIVTEESAEKAGSELRQTLMRIYGVDASEIASEK